jgi:predicted membrane protein
MLPAYQTSTFYVLFFFIYLMFGIYFLFNTLLATIFTNYKKRLELRVEKRESQRQLFLERHFDELDKEKKGWLNENEAKKFFQTVFDFDYSERAD